MARKGRVDRGLVHRKNTAGKSVWYVRLAHEGKECWFGSFPSKTKAREFYEARKVEQREGRLFPDRFQQGKAEPVVRTIDQFVEGYAGKSRHMYALYGNWWKHRLGGKRLNEIRPLILDEAQQTLKDQGLAPQTVLHYLKFLRHLLNLAVRDGKLLRNPFTQVKLPKVTTRRTRFLTTEEEKKLLEVLGTTYGPWARFAILTGLRRSEQFSMHWTDVDLERGMVTLPTTKAGGVQYIPLDDEAQRILKGLNSWQRSVWVFPSENPATPLDTRNFYSRVWIPAVKQAGIEWVTWHDLRHTFASRLAMSGASDGTIATLLRHSTTALVKRYAHLSPSHLRYAVQQAARFGLELTGNRDGIEMTAHATAGHDR